MEEVERRLPDRFAATGFRPGSDEDERRFRLLVDLHECRGGVAVVLLEEKERPADQDAVKTDPGMRAGVGVEHRCDAVEAMVIEDLRSPQIFGPAAYKNDPAKGAGPSVPGNLQPHRGASSFRRRSWSGGRQGSQT